MPIPAGVVRNPQRPALITLIDMTAQFCRAANLDRPHGTKMTNGHRMPMDLPISRPKSPKDIGHL